MPTPNTLESLGQAFDRVETEMKAALDRQDKEIRDQGASSSATSKRVEELGNQLTEIGSNIQAAREENQQLQDKLGKAQERIVLLENLSAQPRLNGRGRPKSIGQLFIESEQYKTAVAQNAPRTDRYEFEGSFFAPHAELSSTEGEGGATIRPERLAGIVYAPERPPVMRDLMDVQPTQMNAIEFVEETGFTNAADTVAEKATKPESNMTFAVRTANIQTIAHWVLSTRQILADSAQLRSHVDRRLTYGVRLAEEAQIIYGTGTSPDLQGIATHSSVQTYTQGDDVASETKIDAIRRGILRARRAEYPVEGILLNPDDWAAIELTKDSQQRYIWVQVPEGGVMRLWRVPIVDSTAIDVGDVLLGAWSLAATLWDREQSNIRVSDQHAEIFLSNQVVILGEERVGLSIYRPEAFVLVTLDSAS